MNLGDIYTGLTAHMSFLGSELSNPDFERIFVRGDLVVNVSTDNDIYLHNDHGSITTVPKRELGKPFIHYRYDGDSGEIALFVKSSDFEKDPERYRGKVKAKIAHMIKKKIIAKRIEIAKLNKVQALYSQPQA